MDKFEKISEIKNKVISYILKNEVKESIKKREYNKLEVYFCNIPSAFMMLEGFLTSNYGLVFLAVFLCCLTIPLVKKINKKITSNNIEKLFNNKGLASKVFFKREYFNIEIIEKIIEIPLENKEIKEMNELLNQIFNSKEIEKLKSDDELKNILSESGSINFKYILKLIKKAEAHLNLLRVENSLFEKKCEENIKTNAEKFESIVVN